MDVEFPIISKHIISIIIPAGNYMFKLSNRNTSVSIVNFEHVLSDLKKISCFLDSKVSGANVRILYFSFLISSCSIFSFDWFLTLSAPISQNDQTHSKNLIVSDHFVGLALKGLRLLQSSHCSISSKIFETFC